MKRTSRPKVNTDWVFLGALLAIMVVVIAVTVPLTMMNNPKGAKEAEALVLGDDFEEVPPIDG